MTIRIIGGLVLAILCTAYSLAQDQDPDLKKLHGTWRLLGQEYEGEASEKDVIDAIKQTLLIQGDRLIWKDNGRENRNNPFKIMSTKEPKQIDVTAEDIINGKAKPRIMPGIYKLEGDNLVLVISNDANRPTKFASPKGSGMLMETYVRDKAQGK